MLAGFSGSGYFKRSASIVKLRVKNLEVFDIVGDATLAVGCWVLQIVQHLCVVGLFVLRLAWLLLILLTRTVEEIQEVLEALDVFMNSLELLIALFWVVCLLTHACLVLQTLLWNTRPPDEVDFSAILLRLVGNLLVETFNRH